MSEQRDLAYFPAELGLMMLRFDLYYYIYEESIDKRVPARVKLHVEKESGIYTVPVIEFVLPDRSIFIRYRRHKKEYVYSEPIDFALEFRNNGGAWYSNQRNANKPIPPY